MQVRKHTLTKTGTRNKHSEIQSDIGILSDYHRTVTNTNPNRKEKNLYNKDTTEAEDPIKCTSSTPTPRISREVTHIEFLKVHKAASSTVQSIILRFGLKRNLSVVIPTPSIYISHDKYFFSDLWPPLPKPYNERLNADDSANKYDTLSHHMVFNRKKVSQFLHNDSKYIAVVREPFDQFLSAAHYYKFVFRHPYLHRLSNETFITDLIRNPKQYEASSLAGSMTYNSMARDFGFEFSLKHAENISVKTFQDFLKETASTFHLVMAVEHFDESLVMLKRLLNWSLEDIIYAKINTFQSLVEYEKYENFKISANDLKLFRRRNRFDYSVYNFFNDRLKEQIAKEEHFEEEVTHFKAVRSNVQKFCLNIREEKLKLDDNTANERNENDDKKSVENMISDSGELEFKENKINQDLKSRKNKTSKYRIDKQANIEMTNDYKAEGETTLAELIASIIRRKKITKRQEEELPSLEKLLEDGSLNLKFDKLSDILNLIFYNKEFPTTYSKLLVPKSKWNKEFFVTSADCDLITLDIMSLYTTVKENYMHLLTERKFGSDFSVIEAVKYISTFF